MKISTKWLAQYVQLPESPEKLADRETVTGIEVDEIIKPDAGLKKLVTGKIVSLKAHPDSDHLNVCQVDVNQDELLQIVCGAPNVAQGQTVIVALPGARIADNQKIKKGKFRGVESNGMLCALQEIGFDDAVVPNEFKNGIYVFSETEEIPLGQPVYPYLGMDDTILDFDLTPNRADALGMRGAAWEVAAMYDEKPEFEHSLVQEGSTSAADKLSVEVPDVNLAPTYRTRVINNVQIKPSPLWLQVRLWNNGIKPINNIVDITNYIMLDFGQPLHAYDYDKLGSKKLTVRLAAKGEQFTALNEKVYDLDDQDIVISNDEQAVGLAGVMGGLATSVTDQTKNIILEAGVFNPTKIRKTAQRHNLRTDASARFEKGVDLSAVAEALDTAAQLVTQLADGDVLAEQLVGSQSALTPTVVKITVDQINHALGTEISEAEVIAIFERLGFHVEQQNNELVVTVPLRRWDIFIESDLIEEVARIYGFDKIPSTLPVGTQTIGGYTPRQKFLRQSRRALRSLGYDEVISYSLTTEEKAAAFSSPDVVVTKVDWPMTQDHEYLRTNLVSGLLDDLAYNAARKQTDVAIFEQGRVFVKSDKSVVRPAEVEMIAGAISGNVVTSTWNQTAQTVDFYNVKGDVEQLIASFNKKATILFQATGSIKKLHPGQTAIILMNEQPVGFVGTVHPQVLQKLRLAPTVVFQLDLEKIMALPDQSQIYVETSKYPAIQRDIALILPDVVTNESVELAIQKVAGPYLTDIQLFDVYAGKGITSQHKSLAYRLTFQNSEATLTDVEVNHYFDAVKQTLQDLFNAQIR
ncbi:phenylalanine--tRNA ligase subunit beta [Bombilactobacillus folatiphilus]|uniref:Phenylalanine--tRNA ligase beta subunit n=1 Tax=Bombilactobacillus folatiphilus TaxID=2923362 RepID=A0ABY4PA84_9LACO|nr:phenylalanine--tRNA ligase subunit beta [Bombilactobacillus folatiphilus]UQS82556.1 phenylalanine--tRNA ligase subunit beta [Bombilactobacillus folatiphilus]